MDQPKIIGDYVIHYKWPKGKGAFGVVYLAESTKDAQIYAVKIVPSSTNSTDIQREKNNLQLAATISHPNITKLHHWQEVKGNMYLFLQLCDTNLKDWLKQRGKLSENEA
jgi:serine/threonine protein kinase